MPFLSPSQCRAARGLLKWSQPDLSVRSGVNIQTICAFENDSGTPTRRTLQKLTGALEMGGVLLTPDGGIAPRGLPSRYLRGTDGLRELMDDIYMQAGSGVREIRLWNAKPSNWMRRLGYPWFENHALRMQALVPGGLRMRITCVEGETNFVSSRFASYRWVPESMFNDQSIYAYGDRMAFLNFEESTVNIYILYNRAFADSFRVLFDEVWDKTAQIPAAPGHCPAGQI